MCTSYLYCDAACVGLDVGHTGDDELDDQQRILDVEDDESEHVVHLTLSTEPTPFHVEPTPFHVEPTPFHVEPTPFHVLSNAIEE